MTMSFIVIFSSSSEFPRGTENSQHKCGQEEGEQLVLTPAPLQVPRMGPDLDFLTSCVFISKPNTFIFLLFPGPENGFPPSQGPCSNKLPCSITGMVNLDLRGRIPNNPSERNEIKPGLFPGPQRLCLLLLESTEFTGFGLVSWWNKEIV